MVGECRLDVDDPVSLLTPRTLLLTSLYRRADSRPRPADQGHPPERCEPPATGPCAKGSSSTCSAAASPPTKPRRQLDIAVDWGRYGELLEYDAERAELIPEPAEPAGR